MSMSPVVRPGEIAMEFRRIGEKFGTMTHEDRIRWAETIVAQKRIWIEETLASNKWIAFRDRVSRLPILWRFGKGAWKYYEEHYPERLSDLQDAVGILMGVPLVRTVWSELNRGGLLFYEERSHEQRPEETS